jgi:hypothetical protein
MLVSKDTWGTLEGLSAPRAGDGYHGHAPCVIGGMLVSGDKAKVGEIVVLMVEIDVIYRFLIGIELSPKMLFHQKFGIGHRAAGAVVIDDDNDLAFGAIFIAFGIRAEHLSSRKGEELIGKGR